MIRISSSFFSSLAVISGLENLFLLFSTRNLIKSSKLELARTSIVINCGKVAKKKSSKVLEKWFKSFSRIASSLNFRNLLDII